MGPSHRIPRHRAARRATTRLAVVLAAVLLVPVACSDSDSSDAGEEPADTASSTGAAELPEPVALDSLDLQRITAEPFGDWILTVGTDVWVAGVRPGLVRYDGDTGKVTAEVEVPDAVYAAMDASGPTLWLATSARSPELIGVDTDTARISSRTPLPDRTAEETSVAAGPDAVYVLVGSARRWLLRVDPQRDDVRRLAELPGASGVRYGFGSLWVPRSDGTVDRLDPDTGDEQDSVRAGLGPRFTTVGQGAVWVMNQGDGSVTRIDPDTAATETIVVSDASIQGGDIATGPGAVWVRTSSNALARVDARTGEVTDLLGSAIGSGGVAATGDAVWMTAHDELAVYRIPWPQG
jgi:hypothetical protein